MMDVFRSLDKTLQSGCKRNLLLKAADNKSGLVHVS